MQSAEHIMDTSCLAAIAKVSAQQKQSVHPASLPQRMQLITVYEFLEKITASTRIKISVYMPLLFNPMQNFHIALFLIFLRKIFSSIIHFAPCYG